jgi:hypothetical protein
MSQEPLVSHTTLDAASGDADWLAAPSRRSRFRVGAVVALAVLLVLLAGVEVQKRWGAASTSASSFPTGAAFPTGASFPAGGSLPAGTTSGTTPAVIGRLTRIQGHTWTVKDLGGKSHAVKVTAATTVTRSLASASGAIRTGADVTVQGASRGTTITATAVTIR